MKSIILLTLIAGSLNLPAQKLKGSAVPAVVKESFKKQFPDVSDADWEKEEDRYEAEFETKNTESGKPGKKIETSAVFDSNGKLIYLEHEIPVTDLPSLAVVYMDKNVPGRKIKEAAKIIDAAGNVSFEAEINGSDYIFDVNGNFIRKEEKK